MHTPAPWHADHYGIRNDGGYIVKLHWPSRYDGQDERYALEMVEREADSKLICAAPDLLRCLIDAQEELRLIRMKDCDRVYDPTLRIRMQHAIAKAGASA